MRLLWSITAAAAGVSLLAKVLVDRFLMNRIPIIGSFAGLQYSLNPGVAFGIRFPPFIQELLIGAALLAVLWLAIRSTRSLLPPSYQLRATSYELILGGGIANIIDRLPDGVVTDYFQIGTFPVFNVADSCISIGVLMLLMEMLVWRRCKT
ncbi:MAG: signal peptidase II [Candidatus Peribacteraceae bacterium]|nr:signal peptidase II [Candidatus Peribacteraceae bacterium]MDD5739644.1 signal peptidase II [Candidatus Peribacteraceae bacterium]